jgi:hypothetical protein
MSYRRSECENGPGGEAAGSVFVEKSPVGKFHRTPDRRRSRLRLSFYRRS